MFGEKKVDSEQQILFVEEKSNFKRNKDEKKLLSEEDLENWDNYGWEANLSAMVSLILSRHKKKKNFEEDE